MGYKTILAVLDTPKDAKQITEFSIALAEQYGSHVIGLHAESLAAVPLVAPMEIPDPATVQALQDMAHAETVDIEKLFRDRSARNGTSHEWRSFISSAGFNASSLIDSARAVDLVVAAQGENSLLSETRADLEHFLFESGRPVLLVPYILKEPKPIKRVLVAWNGSREAARATFDALPFLKAADAVEIFSVDPPETSTQSASMAGAEIAATLARHGVNITVVRQETDTLPASAAIENRLSDSSIDLLVMGAYSHKRWWEMLFGGVTRTLLDSMTALTLLSR
ncbi:MAG: universal stress protein [Rhizobium sp.]